jgi:hypothetical protein
MSIIIHNHEQAFALGVSSPDPIAYLVAGSQIACIMPSETNNFRCRESGQEATKKGKCQQSADLA